MNLLNKSSFIASAFLSFALAFTSQVFAQDDELLPSEEAFAFKAETSTTGITANWTIADGYYMYKDKLSFSLADSAGNPIDINYDFPKSKSKDDPLFGAVDVYLKHADFNIPVDAAGAATLTVKGQGCNEPVGVCYPPIKHEIALNLIAANDTPSNTLNATLNTANNTELTPQLDLNPEAEEIGSISELRDLLGTSAVEDELLPPDEAFQVSAIEDRDGVNVRFKIADGYYLYQNKLKFDSGSHALQNPILPEGELKQDEYYGESVVYKHEFDALIKLARANGDKTLILDAEYQGLCRSRGLLPTSEENL